ncbi:MAG: TetR/AcrR family transcriptional regulator [Verrucomicrobiales bacterium]|nr:TetR/AcrR family transcriptional regulator [Verrucomicrobiales bacterium]
MPRAKSTSTSADARQKIVAAARSHFLAHGFRSVTMDDLAAEVGMSKKTFYAHFPSKLALVEAVMQEKIREAEADMDSIPSAAASSFPETLHALLACMQKHTGEIQPAFIRDVRRDAADIFANVETRRAAMIKRSFTRLLTAGRKAGMIRGDVPQTLIIEMLLAATHQIMNPQKLDELNLTAKAGYSAIIDIILRGAMTAQGREEL